MLRLDGYLVLVGLARGRGRVDSLDKSDGWLVILLSDFYFGVCGCGFTLA